MSAHFPEFTESNPQRRFVHASTYSAHVQEAMRYDKLSSSDYALVMTLLDAAIQGYTREKWEEVQQRMLQTLIKQSPDKRALYADAENRYEQIIAHLKDLSLWPWTDKEQ